tara:strand:- start:71 stop:1039 length:969 start_codon:yes stop_codon:yes gene_type:complete
MKISQKIITQIYYQILRIRKIESKISEEYDEWKMRCPVHLSIGQESIAAPLSVLFKNRKYEVLSSHRAHAHYLGKGGNLYKLISEIMGKSTGCSGGKGGSMHLSDKDAGFLLSTAIVANSIPVAAGVALSKKIKKEEGLALAFFGDGAIEEGVFYETINFSIIKNLPIIFICENNKYSVYSNLGVRQPKNRKIHKMVEKIGIKSLFSNGLDAIEIYKKYLFAKNYVEKKNKPIFLEINTYRYLEHCGPFNDDNLKYRTKKEIGFWKKNDPLITLEKKYNNILTKKKISYFKKIISDEINLSFNRAKRSKFPKSSIQEKEIYA